MTTTSENTVREALGYFTSVEDLDSAIDDLLSSGFNRAELSLLASEHTVDEKLGHRYKKVTELADDAATPRTFYVSDESVGEAKGALIGAPIYLAALGAIGVIVASGGALATVIAGAALAGGAGGLIGSAFAKLLGVRQADYLQEQLDHGGLLLWVRTPDEEHETRATEILKRHSGRDVHVHTIAA